MNKLSFSTKAWLILAFAIMHPAQAHPTRWVPAAISGVIIGTMIERHHDREYVPQYAPQQVIIVPQPGYAVPNYVPQYSPPRVPVDIDRYGRPYCPPGYRLVQQINAAGYVENVGCIL